MLVPLERNVLPLRGCRVEELRVVSFFTSLDCANNNIDPREMFVTGGKSLAAALKSWTHKKDVSIPATRSRADTVPEP